jgi:hypothetical protein
LFSSASRNKKAITLLVDRKEELAFGELEPHTFENGTRDCLDVDLLVGKYVLWHNY